jgi:hypothetical protein
LTAIRSFTAITLRRSVLHQGIVVALSAVGLGLAVNTLINADLMGWLAAGEAIVVLAAVGLSWRRAAFWKHTTLAFEDDLPTDVNPLRLID